MSSYDHEEACRYMLRVGEKIAHPGLPDWQRCPVCQSELEWIAQSSGFVLPFCHRYYLHPKDMAEMSFPDVERHSEKLPTPIVKLPLGARQRNRAIQETTGVPSFPPKREP